MGAVAGPFDAWLVLRGIKTLGVRMDRHCDNAERVVELPAGAPDGRRGALPRAARRTPATRSPPSRCAGSAAWCRSGSPAARRRRSTVCDRAELFTLGESLGGVESLIEHPGRMTHASVAGSPLEVPADLVRLSVGIETVDDLLADLRQALDGLMAAEIDPDTQGLDLGPAPAVPGVRPGHPDASTRATSAALLRDNAAAWRDVLSGRTPQELRSRPDPGTWSALEYALPRARRVPAVRRAAAR